MAKSQKKLKQKMLVFLVPLIFKILILPLFWTLKKKRLGEEYHDRLLASGKPFIITFWHYGVVCAAVASGQAPQIAMASASRDGDYIAAILEAMGVETVRGSRNVGGVGALKGLLKGVKRGLHPVLVADGSQGPARIAQAGGVLLASRTGIPILPMGWSFERYKVFRSWDRTMIPLPFSRMIKIVGEPLHVPPKLDADGLERYRKLLEDRLNGLYNEAWAVFGIEDHAPG